MRTLLFALLLGCLVLVGLWAQQPATPAPAAAAADSQQELDENTIRLDVNRVNILFTVTDKRGRFITDLGRTDFDIFEGRRRQEILEFTAETDLPLRMAILIDTSNSIRDRFRFQQEAAIEFLRSTLRGAQDKSAVVSFDTTAELASELENDLEKLAVAIRKMRPGGGTSLYDAIYFTCKDTLQKDQPRHMFRRAMVILSDGEDTQSRVTRDQALEMAQKADVVIYTISTNITRQQTTGDKVLRYFAQETGGLVFFPFKVEDLAQSFENIANELRHQYNVFYRPDVLRTDGSYQEVDVKVKGKNMVVRARKGYYAPRL
jgi:Ca-activated chloride channel homolog